MPPRFPTYEDVPLPGISGPRPVAGYDVSAYGAGTQALAQGVSNLGTGIEKGAGELKDLELYKARNNALMAQDQIIGDVYKAREEFKHDTDYGTLTDRWDKRADDIVQQGIQNVPEGPMRNHVMARLQIPLARTRDQVEDYAFNGASQQAHADLANRAYNIVQGTGADEDPWITQQMDDFNSWADHYVGGKYVTPLQAQQYKQKLALSVADARGRARLDRAVANGDPAEIEKVLNELRNSIPRGGAPGAAPGPGASIYPPGGWGPTDHAASVTAKAETGDPTLGPKALGNISPDKSGSKSYGFMGLNSGTGSATAFAMQYGRQFGLTARPGSVTFDQQWKDAAQNHTAEFRQAQLAFFNERVVPTITADLTKRGIPDNIANDPRVVTYFADRKIQMGIAGIDAVREAWAGAGGDAVQFMRNMNDVDRRNIESNFKTTLAERLYSPEGHETRLRTRLEGALATGRAGPPGADDSDPSTLMDRARRQYPVLNNEDIPYKYSPGKSDNMLESWQPGEPGDDKFKRPGELPLNKFGVEVYDAKTRPIDILGDVVSHRLINTDPKIKQYYSDFVKSITPHQEEILRDQYEHAKEHEGEKRSYEQWKEMTGLPAFFRGHPFQQWPEDFNKRAYTPEQTKNLDEMMDYLRGGKSEGGTGAPSTEAPTGYSGDPLFQKLTAQHRDALITRAQQALNQFKRDANTQLQARMTDDYAAATRDGYLDKSLTRDDFTKVHGEADGAKAFDAYADGLQQGYDSHNLATMSPDEQAATLERWQPRQGEEGYIYRAQRADQMAKAVDGLHQALQKDPAAYVMNYAPDVQQAWQAFGTATTPEEKQQAAQAFAAKTTAEQLRLGVAPQNVSVVPKSYINSLMTQLAKPAASGGPDQTAAMIKAQADLWGPAWPSVYRQMKGASPLVEVLGAGVKPAAAQLLADNANISFKEIVKDEQSGHAKDINESVDKELAPFASSLLGNAGGIAVYNSFRGQIEKLAAIYSFQKGMNAQDAAKQATDDVLNFKYDYRDGYRIPAKEHSNPAGVPSDDIQAGAAMARAHLGETYGGVDLAVKPAIDTFGGAYTPDQLASEKADTQRNGRWTTNADETGLAYVYGGQVVRKPDGTPLQLTWKQLGDLARNKAAASGLEQYGTALP